MAEKETRLESLSLTNYSFHRNPSGSISFSTPWGNATIQLDVEDAEKIMAVAYEIARRRLPQMGAAVANTTLPQLIGYDSSKTIEGKKNDEEVPF